MTETKQDVIKNCYDYYLFKNSKSIERNMKLRFIEESIKKAIDINREYLTNDKDTKEFIDECYMNMIF